MSRRSAVWHLQPRVNLHEASARCLKAFVASAFQGQWPRPERQQVITASRPNTCPCSTLS